MFYESLYHERGEESEMAERWCVVHGVLEERVAAVIVKRWGKGAGISEGYRKRLEREAKRRKAQAASGGMADSEEKKEAKGGKKESKGSKKEDGKVKRERSEEMDDEDNYDVPLAKKAKTGDVAVKKEAAVKREDEDDSDDDVPLAARKG